MSQLNDTAKLLVAEGKGIIAADAGEKSIDKRLKAAGASGETLEGRRRCREVLFTAKGLGQYISGVIMNEESFNQSAGNGTTFIDALQKEGIMPGIKVDRGPVDMPNFPNEKVTEGLDGLGKRLEEFAGRGAKFTKWRAVITISETGPTRQNILANAHILARYAALSQQAGLVPIVEPEVLMDGTHTMEKCAEVTEQVGRTVFEVLLDMKVDPGGLLYKTNMAIMGKQSAVVVTDEQIAAKTVEVLKKTVSVAAPGVVFLSGGQEPVAATKRLNEIVRAGAGAPWKWTFSFERAFEEPVIQVWKGKDENILSAQLELVKRARLNSLASLGKYNGEL